MNLALRIDNNVVAIIVSIIFLLNIVNRLDRKDIRNRFFIGLFIVNTGQLSIETITCLINEQPYLWLIPITVVLHTILFMLGPLFTYLWYAFVDVWINNKKEVNLKRNMIFKSPLVISSVLILSSPFTKATFYITKDNVYERGALFLVPLSATYFYVVCNIINVYWNRKKLNKVEFLSLFLLGAVPILAGVIQALFYGILLAWSCAAYTIIILFLYLQQQMMQVDSLTGAWCREKLHIFLNDKIEGSSEKGFAIVFIDLDNFKIINDTYGHIEGDKALISFVKVVNCVLRGEDSITRYGGDEFVLFLNVETKDMVETVMSKISDEVEAFNINSNNLYQLEYSYGYDLYDYNTKLKADKYINHVDKLMYEAKNKKKQMN